MNKGVIVGVVAGAGLAGAAVYVAAPAPAASGPLTGPIVVGAPPAEVLGRLRAASLDDVIRREAAGSGLDAIAAQMTLKHEGGSAREDVASVWLGSEKILVLRTRVRPVGAQTELDIHAELPPSSLTRERLLTPQDRTLMAAIAERAASDYAAVVVDGRPAADHAALARGIETAFGLDARGQRAFEARARDALHAPADAHSTPPPSAGATPEAQDDAHNAFGQPDDAAGDTTTPEAPEGANPEPALPAGVPPLPDDGPTSRAAT